jgi:hypothetical protein
MKIIASGEGFAQRIVRGDVLDPGFIAIEVETTIGRTLLHGQACDGRHRAHGVNSPWSSTTCRPRGRP